MSNLRANRRTKTVGPAFGRKAQLVTSQDDSAPNPFGTTYEPYAAPAPEIPSTPVPPSSSKTDEDIPDQSVEAWGVSSRKKTLARSTSLRAPQNQNISNKHGSLGRKSSFRVSCEWLVWYLILITTCHYEVTFSLENQEKTNFFRTPDFSPLTFFRVNFLKRRKKKKKQHQKALPTQVLREAKIKEYL